MTNFVEWFETKNEIEKVKETNFGVNQSRLFSNQFHQPYLKPGVTLSPGETALNEVEVDDYLARKTKT